jgi:hypothetical protein
MIVCAEENVVIGARVGVCGVSRLPLPGLDSRADSRPTPLGDRVRTILNAIDLGPYA